VRNGGRSGFLAARSPAPAPGLRRRAGRAARHRPPLGRTGRRRQDQAEDDGLHSACAVRDRPVAVATSVGRHKVVRLAVPVSNSQRGAAGILNGSWHLRPGGRAAPAEGGLGPGVGDDSVAAGTGSSRVRGGGFPACYPLRRSCWPGARAS